MYVVFKSKHTWNHDMRHLEHTNKLIDLLTV